MEDEQIFYIFKEKNFRCNSCSSYMEETDSGNFYLTIRMSLMDYTSGHSFQVQNWGDTAWQDTAAGITRNGSDTNGTTADICIQVPSENSIVRGTMYVEPMGRWVIWYMYLSDFKGSGIYHDEKSACWKNYLVK